MAGIRNNASYYNAASISWRNRKADLVVDLPQPFTFDKDTYRIVAINSCDIVVISKLRSQDDRGTSGIISTDVKVGDPYFLINMAVAKNFAMPGTSGSSRIAIITNDDIWYMISPNTYYTPISDMNVIISGLGNIATGLPQVSLGLEAKHVLRMYLEGVNFI